MPALLDHVRKWKRPERGQRDHRRYSDVDPSIRHLLTVGWIPAEIRDHFMKDRIIRAALPSDVTSTALYRHICRVQESLSTSASK